MLNKRPARRSVNDQITLASIFAEQDQQYGLLSERYRVARESGNNRPQPPSTKALTLTAKSRKSHIHRRGNFLDLGEAIRPATLDFLRPLQQRGELADRLDFARWLVDPQHPLTSRVAVNHIWRRLFGRGLVATPDNFGLSGQPPSHPQLLDWLATEYVRGGWSTKSIIRLIVTSAAGTTMRPCRRSWKTPAGSSTSRWEPCWRTSSSGGCSTTRSSSVAPNSAVTENAKVGLSAGRDHHRYGFSVWLAGGGSNAGHVVGSTDEVGWHAVEDRVHVNDFHATLLHLMGLDHKQLVYRFRGLDVRLTNLGGKVVEKIFS